MSPIEMMVKQVVKGFGLEPEKIIANVDEMRTMVFALMESQLRTERRCMRIETALGLSDIEPIPTKPKVIEHEQPSSGA